MPDDSKNTRDFLEQLQDSTDDELMDRMTEIHESLLNLRFRQASGQVQDPKRVRKYRKAIARIHTVLRERELGIVALPARSQDIAGEAPIQ